MREKHPALFLEMRLGKTLIALRRCAMYAPRDSWRGLRVLVAAPISAIGAWQKEATLEGWAIIDLTGARRKRFLALGAAFSAQGPWSLRGARVLCLINREGWQALPEIADMPWDAVIADESTFLKNPRAKVTRFFIKSFRSVPHRWILTGTPCPEGEEEYFCQLAFLRGGAFGFSNFYRFRLHYMEPHPSGYGWTMKNGAADHIRRTVGRTCYILRRRDAGMDREKIRERRELILSDTIRKIYDKAEEELILATPDGEISTKWITTAWQWLRQICGGFIDGRLSWIGKIKETLDLLLGELAKEQVVIWACYNREVAALVHALRGAKISCDWWTGEIDPQFRESKRRAVMAGHFRVLVLQQATAQTGMDLSAAGTAIYYSTPPGQLARVQTEDRILSVTKPGPLLYIDLIVKDSVDVDVAELLEEKKLMTELSLARALRAAMQRRRRR